MIQSLGTIMNKTGRVVKYAGSNLGGSHIEGIVNHFSPVRIIDSILDYRKQIKLIDARMMELEAMAELAHHRIDNSLKLELKKLEKSHLKFKKCVKVFKHELDAASLSRKQVHITLDKLNNSLDDERIPMDIRFGAILNTIVSLTDRLAKMSEDTNVKLSMVFDITMKELDNNKVSEIDFKFDELLGE